MSAIAEMRMLDVTSCTPDVPKRGARHSGAVLMEISRPPAYTVPWMRERDRVSKLLLHSDNGQRRSSTVLVALDDSHSVSAVALALGMTQPRLVGLTPPTDLKAFATCTGVTMPAARRCASRKTARVARALPVGRGSTEGSQEAREVPRERCRRAS